jgi:hypothetical protein
MAGRHRAEDCVNLLETVYGLDSPGLSDHVRSDVRNASSGSAELVFWSGKVVATLSEIVHIKFPDDANHYQGIPADRDTLGRRV